MNVVDKVMVWLGFERCDEPATPGHEGKVLYKKRGVDVIPHRDYQATASQGEAAARAHIELTLFDKAVLWIFERIVSPLMKPLPLASTVTVAPADIADPSAANTNIGALSDKKIVAEEEFSNQKKIIKTFLDKEFWPSGGHVFSDEVRRIATAHWEVFEKLTEKSGVSEEDRLTYAAAAFVLGKGSPSFEARASDLDHDLPLIDDDNSKVETEKSVDEIGSPKKTNGEILFYGFHNWDGEKKSVDFLSLGSEYMQSDCLEFAQKIVNNSMAIEFGGKTEFTKDILESANVLLKLNRQLEAGEQKRIKEEKTFEERTIIQQKKSLMEEGEWDFNEFFKKFIVHKNNETKLPLPDGGRYRTNPALVKYAEKIIDDKNSEELKKKAATYLIQRNDRPAVALTEVGPVPMPPGIDVDIPTDRAVSPPPPPSSPPTPRWMSTLSSILGSLTGSRDEMPDVFATVLMPNHGMEDRNLAWQGLYLLLSPIGKNISSAVTSENEAALSYQHNSVSANEDRLKRFELATYLIKFLEGLNVDDALKGLHVTRPSNEQIKAIRRLQSNVTVLRKELEDRINVLSPAKTTVVTLPSKIPALDSLKPEALTAASKDFNAFVKEFTSLSEQQKLQYQFVEGRLKYSRPTCAAIAQSVIASYKGLEPRDMIKEDQDRLSAAEFIISEFNK